MSRRGNGEGSITRHKKSGLYMARYTIHTAEGPKRKTIYGKKREEVRDKLAKALADGVDGLAYDDENMTVGQYLNKWLNSSVRGSVRESTFDCYEVICRRHIILALGRIKLSKLTPIHVQDFYRDRLDSGLAAASVHKCHTVLHKALGQAVKWHLIPRNVCDAEGSTAYFGGGDANPLARRDAASPRNGTWRQAGSTLRARHHHRDEAGRTLGVEVARR
jgi:integrase